MNKQPILVFLIGCLLTAIGFVGSVAAEQTELPYGAIQAAFLREDFAQVVRLTQPYLEPVSLEPQAIRIRLWYCLSLERLQRANDALRELDRLKAALVTEATAAGGGADRERVWPEVLFWEGEISRRAFQLIRARLAYHRLLSVYPNSMWRSQAQLGLGLVLFQQHAYDVARQQMAEVLRGNPPSWLAREAQVVQGLCELQVKEYGAAAARFRRLLTELLDPTIRAKTAFYLGESLTGLREAEAAMSAYDEAIRAEPHGAWARMARFGLGWSLFQQHRCRESLNAFADYRSTSATEADRQQPELLFAQGRCLLEVGRDREAAEQLETLRRMAPTHPLAIDAVLSLAEVLERQRRAPEAIALLAPVLNQPLVAAHAQQALLRLGALYLAQGDGANALEQFQRVPDDAEPSVRQAALNGQGDAHLSMGRPEEAMRCYERARALSPESTAADYALYQLGRLKLQAGQISAAIGLFEQLMGPGGAGGPARAELGEAGGPPTALAADARLALAVALLSNAQPDQARNQLEQLRRDTPESAQAGRAAYYLALLALHEEDEDEATHWCDEVIRRVPQSDEAIQARLLLADMVIERGTPEQALATLPRVFEQLQLPSEALGLSSGARDEYRGRLAKKFGDVAQQAGAYAQTIDWYELAWEALPALRGELDYRIASCYEQAGDVAVAAHRYQAIAQAPWQVRGQLAAAKLMERDQQWQEAMAIYTTITQQPVPEAKIAKERLALLERSSLVHSQ